MFEQNKEMFNAVDRDMIGFISSLLLISIQPNNHPSN